MKKTNKVLAIVIAAMAMVFASCSKDDDNNPVVPSQQEIETKIIGKWKMVETRGEKVTTDYRTVTTYQANGKETVSTAKTHEMVGFVWSNTDPLSYQIKDNHMEETKLSNGMTLYSNIISITDNRFEKVVNKVTFSDGKVSEPHESTVFTKVTVDYSQDIIGMWEGVEMTGYETYGNAEARIEYRADGTYTYYVKDGENWIPSTNADNEYNVDGDWLATRWRPEAGKDYNYEWWDIDEIKEGTMKWSALREKEDGSRFTTTFTWKKVE